MPFLAAKLSCFDRDFKSLAKNHQQETLNAMNKIHLNPLLGKPLHGNIKQIKNYSYNHSPELRIFYALYYCKISKEAHHSCEHNIGHPKEVEIKNCEGLIDFVFVKTREQSNNIYGYGRKYFTPYIRQPK